MRTGHVVAATASSMVTQGMRDTTEQAVCRICLSEECPSNMKPTRCLCKSCYMHTGCAVAWHAPRARLHVVDRSPQAGYWLVRVLSQCEVCLGHLHGDLELAIANVVLNNHQPKFLRAAPPPDGHPRVPFMQLLSTWVVSIVFIHGILCMNGLV